LRSGIGAVVQTEGTSMTAGRIKKNGKCLEATVPNKDSVSLK